MPPQTVPVPAVAQATEAARWRQQKRKALFPTFFIKPVWYQGWQNRCTMTMNITIKTPITLLVLFANVIVDVSRRLWWMDYSGNTAARACKPWIILRCCRGRANNGCKRAGELYDYISGMGTAAGPHVYMFISTPIRHVARITQISLSEESRRVQVALVNAGTANGYTKGYDWIYIQC